MDSVRRLQVLPYPVHPLIHNTLGMGMRVQAWCTVRMCYAGIREGRDRGDGVMGEDNEELVEQINKQTAVIDRWRAVLETIANSSDDEKAQVMALEALDEADEA
jgi:hypothetical protein